MSPRTIKTDVHIYAIKYAWSDEWNLATRCYRPDGEVETSDDGSVRIYLESREIAVKMPSDQVLINAQIDGLKGAIERERAESAKRVAIMEERISKLLCLEAPTQ